MGDYTRIADWENTIAELVKDSMSVAFGVFGNTGKLLDANEAMCTLLDTSKQELNPGNSFINPTLSQLEGTNGEVVFEGLLTIGNYSDISYVLSSKIIRRDNVFFVLAEVDIKKLFDENSKMSELNREVNNLQRKLIKEKKKLQITLDELKETQQMLIHSEKMNAMGQLVAGVAHEINNPLAFVLNNIYSLKNYTGEIIESYKKVENVLAEKASSDIIELVQTIKEEDEIEYLTQDIVEIVEETKNGVDRAVKIVADLRRFSRLDESDVKHIDLIENIHSTLSIIRSEITKKNIQLEFNSNKKLELDCFPGQLNQAILNILANSIYAVENGGRIDLTVVEQKHTVTILIADNGCGIADENIGKVFNPFFTTKPVGEGTGLGLSITYKIITDLHKGTIKIDSIPGRGTEVLIEIPKFIVA
ncbi:ATP-binding protein [uncultured Draconibacterium sp.]|uniref:sensor histidine kinase n=1 Tax=uncultured Draconibacterium sp. TaxID=1573823 RepID=UPI003260BD94